jgi:hypothetical protein
MRGKNNSQSETVIHTSITLKGILQYHGIRSPHPGCASDSLAVSVGVPQDCCFSGGPHLHSSGGATQASGTQQAVHEVSRSTLSTTRNTKKKYITLFFRFSKKKFLTINTNLLPYII